MQRYSPQMQKLEEDLKNLYEDKYEYEEDLRLITEPFGVRPSMNVSRKSAAPAYGYESNVYTDGDGSDSN